MKRKNGKTDTSNINKETMYGIISELKKQKVLENKKNQCMLITSHNSRNRYRTRNSCHFVIIMITVIISTVNTIQVQTQLTLKHLL